MRVILALVPLLILCLILSEVIYPASKRQVDTMKKKIPEVSQYISEHQQGLDALLRIQARINAFNREQQANGSQGVYIANYEIYENMEVEVEYNDPHPKIEYFSMNNISENSSFDFIADDEQPMLQSLYQFSQEDTFPRAINIQPDKIVLWCTLYLWTELWIESPATYEVESSTPIEHRYAEVIDEYWKVVIVWNKRS
jgi:hypothetical protein